MPGKKVRASSSPWPALPPDLAGEVLLRLPSYADRMCFGAVCRSWRAASAGQRRSTPHHPCVVFIDGTFAGGFPEGSDRPFRLPRAAGHHGSCGAWLVFKRYDGGYSLLNPFSMAALPPLPSLASAPRAHLREKPVRAVRERVREEYDVIGLGRRHRLEESAAEPELGTLSVRKLVICSAGLVAAVIGGEGRLGKFAVCRPGAASWSVCSDDQWRRIKDMVMHKGKLYAVDHNEDLLTVTISGDTPTVSRIRRTVKGAPPSFHTRRRLALHYLVDKMGDELLMVRREVCSGGPGRSMAVEERFTVFKADFMSKRWVEVSTLGDGVALFLGRWDSRAVRAPEEHRNKWTDRIFFLDDGAADQLWSPPLYSLSTYNMRFDTTYQLLPVMSRHGADLFPATWLFPEQGTCA